MLVRQYLKRDFKENPFSDIKAEDLEILVLEVEVDKIISDFTIVGI